jgi:hypothetical protein
MGFLCSLVFLANLVSHLSVLNLQLQGKGQTISHLVGHIEGFGGVGGSYLEMPTKEGMIHFPSCQELKENEYHFINFLGFKEIISKICEEFDTIFNNFFP